MKKILLTIGMAVALCVYVSTASALGIGLIGPVSDSGTGFGNVSNILTLQNPSFPGDTEIGSVSWNGSADVLSNDAKNTSNTWLFSAIIATGIAGASDLGIVYNVNQQGNLGGLTTTLNSFTLQVFDNTTGAQVFTTDTCVGCGPGFVPISQGTGGAGYLFDLDAATEAALATYFASPTLYRLGGTGSVSLANDGPDNFFFAKISGVTPVPEPGTFLLLGFGLIGLTQFSRRKFKNR